MPVLVSKVLELLLLPGAEQEGQQPPRDPSTPRSLRTGPEGLASSKRRLEFLPAVSGWCSQAGLGPGG